MRLWGSEERNGVLFASIAALALFTVFAHPDASLSVQYPGNPPYSDLWYILNPFYNTTWQYSLYLFVIIMAMFVVLKRVYEFDDNVLVLWMFSMAFLEAIHAHQNITVILFAPFAILSWRKGFRVVKFMYWLFIPLQKIPWDSVYFNCAFFGTGDGYINPCIDAASRYNFFHIYSLSYIVVLFWFVLPVAMWWKHRRGK